jgi:hypothetical protein
MHLSELKGVVISAASGSDLIDVSKKGTLA